MLAATSRSSTPTPTCWPAVRGGARVFRVGQVDDGELLKRVVLEQLLRADLILTSGGISQGDYDVVKAVMPEIGVCDFASVAMQPGSRRVRADRRRPGADDHAARQPGELVRPFEVFVRPVIRKLMGAQLYVRATVKAARRHAMTSVWGRSSSWPAAWSATPSPGGGRSHCRRPRLVPVGRPGPRQRAGHSARADRVRRGRRAAGRLAARRVAGLSRRWRRRPCRT